MAASRACAQRRAAGERRCPTPQTGRPRCSQAYSSLMRASSRAQLVAPGRSLRFTMEVNLLADEGPGAMRTYSPPRAGRVWLSHDLLVVGKVNKGMGKALRGNKTETFKLLHHAAPSAVIVADWNVSERSSKAAAPSPATPGRASSAASPEDTIVLGFNGGMRRISIQPISTDCGAELRAAIEDLQRGGQHQRRGRWSQLF